MDMKAYLSKIISVFKNEGIENIQIYYENTKTKGINIENSAIESFETIDAGGINVGGNYHNYYACTYIEKYDEQSILAAANYIKQIAELNKQPAVARKFKLTKYSNNHAEAANEINIDIIIENLLETEKKAKAMDSHVEKVTDCSFKYVNKNIILMDDQSSVLEDEYSYCAGVVSVIADQDGVKNNASKADIKNSYEAIDYDYLAKQAVSDAVAGLKASPIKSGQYSVLLRNNVFADIVAGFLPIFKLENVKKGLSKFNNCIGKSVAAAKLTIAEDPQYLNGRVKRSFDDEGNIIQKKNIITNGVLNNLLFSEDENGNTSGNAFRFSYKDKLDVSITNCIINGGDEAEKDIIASINEGIMICALGGLNAGMNAVTGDFSLISSGFYIQNGKAVRPLNQITVGGNIYELLKNISKISSEISTGSVDGAYVEAPSVLIDKLNIGGL